MKLDSNPQEKPRSKQDPAEGPSRRIPARRRYLYEIEFFDAGHAAAASAPVAASEVLFDELEREDGPRDPRLERAIQEAANGWVTSKPQG